MGLKSNYVKIQIGNRNKKYYSELGYSIPEYKGQQSGIYIDVKFSDVPKGSDAKIDCDCDGCGIKLNWAVEDYHKRNKDGKTYCNKCAHALFNSGKNNCRWNPNLTDDDRKERRVDPEYMAFTRKVRARDNYTCQCCGKVGHSLEVHHLNGFDNFKEERLDETNAISLCTNCHNNFHNKYGRGNNTKEQFIEWLGYTLDYLEKYNGELPPPRQIICLEDNVIYESANEASRITGINKAFIQKCCLMYDTVNYGTATKSVRGKHYLYYDIYKNMSKEDIEAYLAWTKTTSFHTKDGRHSNCKKVICTTTNEIFRSMSDAAKKYNINTGRITECCKGIKEYFGFSPRGEKLYWKYYND